MGAIKAIETEYKGHLMRSRLEARWAVFFDKLGIEWLYEPQGYVLGNGESYLPDFWLPEPALWVEVKGAPTEDDWIKLHAASAADGLPIRYEGGHTPADILGQDVDRTPTLSRLLLLGEVPKAADRERGWGWAHVVTSLSARGPGFHQAFFWGAVGDAYLVQTGPEWPWPSNPEFDANGRALPFLRVSWPIADAYGAARSARFEHGQSGAML